MHILIVDTETGGVDSSTDALLTIGALAIRRTIGGEFVVENEFDTVINPPENLKINSTALAKNKLEMSKIRSEGLDEREALAGFIRMAQRYRNKGKFPVLAGWNIHFDEAFLKAAFERQGIAWPFYFITFDVAFYWKHYNLFEKGYPQFGGIEKAAREILDKSVPHDALGDVKITYELLQKFIGSVE